MAIGRLFYKTLGQTITNQTKIGGFNLPSGAKFFDYVSGTGKRGNFQIYSFRDIDGKLLGRESVFFKDGKKVRFSRDYNRTNDIFETTEKAYTSDNKLICVTLNNMFKNQSVGNKTLWEQFKQRHIWGKMQMRYNVLEAGSPKKGVKYTTRWDGTAPKMEYENINKEFTAPNQEYLPVKSRPVPSLVNEKVRHISAIQENMYGLKDFTPPVKRVPTDNVCKGVNYQCSGETKCDGQIFIDQNIYESSKLLETLGHEYKHASDFSNMFRVPDPRETPEFVEKALADREKIFPNIRKFYTESMKKGIIPKDSPQGQELTKVEKSLQEALSDTNTAYLKNAEGHDSYYFEQIANDAGRKEVQKMNEVFEKLRKFVMEA